MIQWIKCLLNFSILSILIFSNRSVFNISCFLWGYSLFLNYFLRNIFQYYFRSTFNKEMCLQIWMNLLSLSFFSINLKLVSAIFYQFFIFSPNESPLKTMKNVFYFIKKALFVLEISFLSTVSRFKRTNGSGIHYDVINWPA